MAGRHDFAMRRRAQRRGKERGSWVYLTASTLVRAGFDPLDHPPYYRTWAGPRGRVVVQLYREQ